MAINPNSRFALPFIPVLDKEYNGAIQAGFRLSKEYLRFSLIGIIGISAVAIVNSIFSGEWIHLVAIPFFVLYCISLYWNIRKFLLSPINKTQISDALYGDMFAIQDVNVELVLTWIENCANAKGRCDYASEEFKNMKFLFAAACILIALI